MSNIENSEQEAGALSRLSVELGTWKPISEKPLIEGESYLVVLSEDNSFGFTHKRPIIAEYGFYKSQPNNWTIFSDDAHENLLADDDILYWMPLPKPPTSA